MFQWRNWPLKRNEEKGKATAWRKYYSFKFLPDSLCRFYTFSNWYIARWMCSLTLSKIHSRDEHKNSFSNGCTFFSWTLRFFFFILVLIQIFFFFLETRQQLFWLQNVFNNNLIQAQVERVMTPVLTVCLSFFSGD